MRILIIVILFVSTFTVEAQDSLLSEELSNLYKPSGLDFFERPNHLPPLNQDTTNACWSFATTSFLESEMARLGRQPVKLSVMFPVYYAFVEKARHFVQTKGASRFAAGDLFTGVTEIVKKYGMVPQSVYRGQIHERKTYNHRTLEAALYEFMDKIKTVKLWNEDAVIAGVKHILNRHLGPPPQKFQFKGQTYTPYTFRDEVMNLPWNEYLMVTSFQYDDYYTFTEFKVPDNWADRTDYFNLPLDVFYKSLKRALGEGYTAAFDADIGEPGHYDKADAAFIPSFDIPAHRIDAAAREFRYENGSTTDDHLMHMLAYRENNGEDWFLVKDSWRSAWEGKHPGFYFFHGSYVKLKVLAYLVHRDAVPEISSRLKMQ